MFLLFMAVWLILNGRATVEIILFGLVISAALFYFMCRYMGYNSRKELLLFRLFPLFIRYLWVLVQEIVNANVCVLRLILSPRLQPEPAFLNFDTDFKTGAARMLLANSITLTPGTITVSVEGDHFFVHCLDRELAEGMEESVFVELLKQMEAVGERWS